MSGFTNLPNWLLDDVMPHCDPNEWRIVCVIARKTLGWGKEVDRISLSQFAKLSGIKSRPTVKIAIDTALAHGFITRQERGNSYEYGLEIKLVQELNQFRNQTDNGLEIKPKTVQKLNTQKKKEKIKEESGSGALALPTLADVFAAYDSATGGAITMAISQEIETWVGEVGEQWAIDAIDTAVASNKRSWAYMKGILRRWKADGRQERATQSVTQTAEGGFYG
jgi:DnaD/phage-associated family protein